MPTASPLVAHGMALNGAIAVCFPLAVLARRAVAQSMPAQAIRPATLAFRERLAEIGRGIALPFAIQGIYLICVPLAGREGVGAVTSFGYAYLIASAVVAVTGSSLGLVTSVPLARAGLDRGRISRHIVSSAWLAIVVIGASAGVFGLAGGTIIHHLLGSGYKASVGAALGRLVVVFSLWAVVSVGVSLTFPLLFVTGAGRRLPLLAVLTIVVQVPLAVIGQVTLGLDGLSLALAATTAFVLAGLLDRARRDPSDLPRSDDRRSDDRAPRSRRVRASVARARAARCRRRRPWPLRRRAGRASSGSAARRVALPAGSGMILRPVTLMPADRP